MNFLEYFFDQIYKQMNVAESLIETLKFEHKGHSYTIMQLLSFFNSDSALNNNIEITVDELAEMFKNDSNRDNLIVLHWFNYNFDLDSVKKTHNIEKTYENILNERSQNIIKQNKNESIDRTIWNLRCSGKSSRTDFENAANLMSSTVLNKPLKEQDKAYTLFYNNMFDGKDENLVKSDNDTIFRIGLSPFVSLFKAFFVAGVTVENWKNLIDFYFRHENIDRIDTNLIATLNYCGIQNEAVFIFVLEKFNQLKILGNFNRLKYYKTFILNYIGALSNIGYINTHDLVAIRNEYDIQHDIEFVCIILKNMIEKLEKLYENIPFEEAQKNLKTVIAFINKNIEIINSDIAIKAPCPRFNTSISTKQVHQEEFDNLCTLKGNPELFMQQVRKSYIDGKISTYEIHQLLQNTGLNR